MKLLEKSKVTVIILLFLFLLVLVVKTAQLSGISSYERIEPVQVNDRENEILIGFSLGTLKEERWLRDRDIVMAKVKELGAEIMVLNANNNDRDQLEQVKYLLGQNIDVLILVPNDRHKASAAVDLAKKQGVRVIAYDRLVLDSKIDLYISFDNQRVGELMAEAVLESVPSGEILIINGATSDNNTAQIKEGYDRVLHQYIESGEIRIIGEEWSPNWMKEYAFAVTDQLLQQEAQIDAIICGNDSLADGAIGALSQHRLGGEVIVVGQDADLTACQRVMEGTQLMTVYKPIEKLAEAAAVMAVQMAREEPIMPVEREIFNGYGMIPFYVLEPVAVHKSNMEDTIIKDGFHRADDVYINRPIFK